jgi:hypothetical protein
MFGDISGIGYLKRKDNEETARVKYSLRVRQETIQTTPGAPRVRGLMDISGAVEPLGDPRFIRRNLAEPLTLFLEDGRKSDISVVDTYGTISASGGGFY